MKNKYTNLSIGFSSHSYHDLSVRRMLRRLKWRRFVKRYAQLLQDQCVDKIESVYKDEN